MTDAEREQLSELKTFAWSSQAVLPLLAARKTNAIGLLLMDFRSGKTDLTARVAELNAITVLEQDIKQKTQEYEQLEKKYGNSK